MTEAVDYFLQVNQGAKDTTTLTIIANNQDALDRLNIRGIDLDEDEKQQGAIDPFPRQVGQPVHIYIDEKPGFDHGTIVEFSGTVQVVVSQNSA